MENHADDVLPDLLDLDAEVLRAYLSELIAEVHGLAGEPPRRILDLGSGTGTGSLALARQFPEAQVIAVDVSPVMLDRLRDKAADLGLADRIRTVQADLDAALPDLGGSVDLAWASASLHHLADPDRVLGEVFTAIRPGGLLAVAEMASLPRFLPDGIGGGLEARLHAVMAEALATEMPHRGADWGPLLSKAGFVVEAARQFTIDLAAPLPAAAGRYAQASLSRMRSGLHDRIGADDLATLATLLDEDGPANMLRRDDLTVRAERTAWLARRP